eukprot:c10170_g1_i1.p1 GENE.c10170_g1_i1~~c10170_g1_i1.p1  ORF type:complete len:481 (+),score=105.45 c10170_g1_i1:201-1445(+)
MATIQLQARLSFDSDSAVEQLIPRFVEFLDRVDAPQLQFAAVGVLAYITAHEPITIDLLRAVPKLIRLFPLPDDILDDEIIWALSNIATNSPECLDLVLHHGFLPPLLQLLSSDFESINILRLQTATWALSNLCDKSQPSFGVAQQALPILARLLFSNDKEVLSNVFLAISNLSVGDNECIQATILNLGLPPRIVELLKHQAEVVQNAALDAIRSIVTGSNPRIQVMINASVLPCLLTLLSHPSSLTREEACSTIAKITAGNNDQIQAVFEAGIYPRLLSLLLASGYEIGMESARALSNTTKNCTLSQINKLVHYGCMDALCAHLGAIDVCINTLALEIIENMLRVGDVARLQNYLEVNPCIDYMQLAECSTFYRVRHLQTLHPNNKAVVEHCRNILEMHQHSCSACDLVDDEI